MVEQLREGAREAGINNLSIVQGLWEDVEVDAADVVLCANVVYGIAELEPFIRKLESSARARVLIPAFVVFPGSVFSPFWKAAHGEERIDLPALPELMNALWEMNIYPDLEMFEPTGPEAVPDTGAALGMARHFVYVWPDTEQDGRLQAAMDDLVVETPGGLAARGSWPRRQGLLGWSPSS